MFNNKKNYFYFLFLKIKHKRILDNIIFKNNYTNI